MTEENRELYDVTIIGGGTAGLYAAYYAGMRGMTTKIIEYLPSLGGTVATFYPEKWIYDIGGIPKISGYHLIEQMKEQAMMFNPTVVLNQAVEGIDTLEDTTLRLVLGNGHTHESRAVIIAAGPGRIKKRRQRKGFYCDLKSIEAFGLKLKNRRISVNENMETYMSGVYVAGDMAGYPNKWRLIASAFNEAITAVNRAKAYLDPSAPMQVYSSIVLDR